MKSSKLKVIFYGFFVAISLLLIGAWLFNSSTLKVSEEELNASQSGESHRLRKNEKSKLPTDLESLVSRLNTSIIVYGKVVDQFGAPVAGASVRLSPINRLEGSEGARNVITDVNGSFFAKDLYGKSLGISAKKNGYLSIPPLSPRTSTAMLSYERGGGGTGNRHADPSNPIVLELLKIGDSIPTFYVKRKRWNLPLNGGPRFIALDTEEGRGDHRIEFRFDSNWNELPMDNEINSKQFDWSFEARVPNGGFVWDRSDLNFEAPESGYKESVRYEYSADMPREAWKRIRKGRYFVKFEDGTYGRIQFEIDGGSDRRSLYMQSWLALEPDARNLGAGNMMITVMEIEEPGK